MTLYLLAERILRLYYGGDPSDDAGITIEDVKRLIVGQMNVMLKTETISLNKQLGDNAPTNLMLATYEVGFAMAYKGYSRVELPAIPVSLPLNMGVWWVSFDAIDDTKYDQFVPMQQGQWSLIKDNSAFIYDGLLLGNQTYEVDGKYLVFPNDLSAHGVPPLIIKLVVTDFSTLGDYDLLPLPADYAEQIVMQVLNILRPTLPEDSVNDANGQK